MCPFLFTVITVDKYRDYYMAIFISYPISTQDTDISPIFNYHIIPHINPRHPYKPHINYHIIPHINPRHLYQPHINYHIIPHINPRHLYQSHINYHTIPHINPRHPYQPSGWYGCLGLIWCTIWKLPYNNLYLSDKYPSYLSTKHMSWVLIRSTWMRCF